MGTYSLLAIIAVTLATCLTAIPRETNIALTAGGSTRSAAQLYGKYCASCHGSDGRAKTTKAKFNHARDITDSKWQDDVSDERIFNSIMNGRNVRGNMPAFSKKMTEQEADSLVTYVRGLRK